MYKPVLDAETVRRLSRIHVARWLWAVACNWMAIAGAIYVGRAWPFWWMYVLAIGVIGARQHALGVLVHEAVHYRVSLSRFWNDFLADYLAGYPLLTPTAGYRAFHLRHHQMLDTPEDPERLTVERFPLEWSFPMPRMRFIGLLLRDLSGLWPKPLVVLLGLIWAIPSQRKAHTISVALLHGLTAGVLAYSGYLWIYVIFWLLPLLTIFPVCFRMRTAAEHSGLDTADCRRYRRLTVDVLSSTRTTMSSRLGRFFFGPHNVGFHTEHHLYPSVPYYRLAEVAKLLRSDPEFEARCHTTPGYWGVINQLSTPLLASGQNMS